MRKRRRVIVFSVRDLKRIKKVLKKLDTQERREEAVKRLLKLAETCHECGMAPKRKLRTSQEWFRTEAYIYQTINSLLREYDEKQVKERLKEIERRLEILLEKREEGEGG